jgi:hypothetical protein
MTTPWQRDEAHAMYRAAIIELILIAMCILALNTPRPYRTRGARRS